MTTVISAAGAREKASPGPAAPERFVVLDSMRGLCALMVVLFHLNADTHFRTLFRNGYASVDFFFILSGFILASAYGGRVHGWRDVAAVMVRRVGRLYPLHLAVLAWFVVETSLTSLLTHQSRFTGERDLPALVQNLFLVQGLTPRQLSWNVPAWSASVELWVNLVFLGGLMAFASPWRRAALGVVVALALAGGVLAVDAFVDPLGAEGTALYKVAVYGLEFVVGALLFGLRGWLRAKGVKLPLWIVLLGMPLAAAPYLYADQAPTLGPIPAFAGAVFLLSFADEGRLVPLERGLIPKLGQVSYSIYLTQMIWTMALARLVGLAGGWLHVPAVDHGELILGGRWAMDGLAALCLVLVVLGSLVTYRWIENPARLWFNRFSRTVAARR